MSEPFQPVLLKRCGKNTTVGIDAYLADGGYQGLKNALAKQPGEVTQTVIDSGLRGRGGAGFSTGTKWTFLPKGHPGPIYLCVNGDESEPGTFNNRVLIEEDPHQVLEGLVIAGYAIGEMYSRNLLGKNILGSGYSLDIHLHRGAGAYICGEETGLIESLEGKRAWPRIKPPFPAVEGAFRKPTIVNNIETLACVTHILDRGPDWFKTIGIPKDPNNPRDGGSYGPKLYCISGHVNKPGLVELPLGVTARELIDNYAGGVWKGRKAKAVVPGGISMGFLSAAELDTPLDFNGPGKVGCLGLGTAAVIVIDDQTSMVDVLYNTCRFFAHESCGQCTPCREGTAWSTKILKRIREGQGTMADLKTLDDISKTIGIMPGTTICGLADGAAWPIKNALQKFRPELEEFIQTGRRSDLREVALAH
jgi:NADH-quinone oxidoreductase subunit F